MYSPGSQVLEERLGSSTDADQQFVWNLGYVDDLVLRDRDTNSSGPLDERLYSLRDLRYCVMALANASGTILERFAYDAYGRSSAMTSLFASRSSSSYDWEFRYTGRREDLESGLLFFRARYYSAELGRFIERDPLGFVDGMSLYRGYFVPGGMDPSGLAITKAECQAAVAAAKRKAKNRNLIDKIFGLDCPIPEFVCEECGFGGTFDRGTNVVRVCYNNEQMTLNEVSDVVHHELVHAADACDGADLPAVGEEFPGNCDHLICSEIRAYSTANCNDPNSLWRNGKSRKECVEKGVLWSIRRNTSCGHLIISGGRAENMFDDLILKIAEHMDTCMVSEKCAASPNTPPRFPYAPPRF